jgi:hypothetical protein
MAAGDRDRIDGLAPQLFGDLYEILLAEAAQIGRALDPVEQRCLTVRVSHKISR